MYCNASIPTITNYSVPSISGVCSLRLENLLLFARHGDRSPIHPLFDDLKNNVTWNCDANESMTLVDSKLAATKVTEALSESWAPRQYLGTCTLGDLTAKGRAMHVEFGQNLREIYVDCLGFLSRKMMPNELPWRSTDMSRTVASAQSLLDGLYPHGTYHHGERITIRTRPYEIDLLHSSGLDKVCPKLAQLKSLAKKDPMLAQIMSATASARQQIVTLAPEMEVADTSKGAPEQIENLMCRRCWGKEQPCYKDNYFPNHVQPEIVKLAMGPLLREMLGILDGGSKAKLHVFLAHDDTVSSILGALRAAPEQHQWPAYRSSLLFEIWSAVKGGVRRKYVRILHDGRPLVTDSDLTGDKQLPWCRFGGDNGETCALDTFRAYLKAHSIDKWDEACKG
ncbi:hypothetical protein GGF31_004547 [Allomyces arbusculus]|nr:hypothetical protein GGF31_004547 [Allomyces arbusculus]